MDSSTILWIVIIVGAMIYNSASKVRKARQKGENPPSQHGEAWPSIPWDKEEAQPRPTTSVRPKQEAAQPVVRPATTPVAEATVRQQSDRRDSGEMPKNTPKQPKSDDHRIPTATMGQPFGDTRPQQPLSGAFPDECQSLEEITIDEYLPEFSGMEAPDWTDRGTATSTGSDLQHANPSVHAAKSNIRIPKGGQNPPKAVQSDPNTEASIAELIEEFDLRRAVIYSEILKPKFEED